MPTLVLHGKDDQVVPSTVSALEAIELMRECMLKTVYSHGMPAANADVLNADHLAFITS